MMQMIEGICAGCGQSQLVSVVDPTGTADAAQRANEIATKKCDCEESKKITAWITTLEVIHRVCDPEVCDPEEEYVGFERIGLEAETGIEKVARLVFDRTLDKAQIELAKSVITIKPKGDGVSIIRKSTLEIGE